MNKLLPAFEDSLFMNFSEPSVDWLEDTLDSLINNEAVENIPILKTLMGLSKTGAAIHERNLIRQTIAFLLGLKNGLLTEEQITA